jgi:hypothetical protein
MNCILKKCPWFIGNNDYGSCNVNHVCDKKTECNIDLEIMAIEEELEKALEIKKIVEEVDFKEEE